MRPAGSHPRPPSRSLSGRPIASRSVGSRRIWSERTEPPGSGLNSTAVARPADRLDGDLPQRVDGGAGSPELRLRTPIDPPAIATSSDPAQRRIFHSKVDTIRPTYGFEDVSLAPGTGTIEPNDVDL